MKIGLSYDQGTPKYRLYVGALLAAADRSGIDVTPFWLAGTTRELDAVALETVDGLILTGGSDVEPHRYGFRDEDHLCQCVPGRDDTELKILERALERKLPTLAICRGMQLLNTFQGGTLIPHLQATSAHRLNDDARHEVSLEPGSGLSRLIGEDRGDVSSSHHQAVAETGEGMRIAARHADGTIEAIEWEEPLGKPWLAAVQWHPERMALDEPFAGLLWRGFLQAVAASHS